MEAIAGERAVQVLVAGQNGAVSDPGRPVATAGSAGQRCWHEAVEVGADPRKQVGVRSVAEFGRGVDEGHVASLVDLQRGIFDHSGVMLDGAVSDHNVTDLKFWIQTAGDTGKRDRTTLEAIGEQGGHQCGVDLAHPGLG